MSGVGLDFYVANTRGEVPHSEKHLKFEEELQPYLLGKEGYPAKRHGFLLNLDQYKDRVFSAREVQELSSFVSSCFMNMIFLLRNSGK